MLTTWSFTTSCRSVSHFDHLAQADTTPRRWPIDYQPAINDESLIRFENNIFTGSTIQLFPRHFMRAGYDLEETYARVKRISNRFVDVNPIETCSLYRRLVDSRLQCNYMLENVAPFDIRSTAIKDELVAV